MESLDKEIKSIEEYRRNTEQTQKRIVGRFIVISVGIYLLTAFLYYFYYFPANFYDRLLYIIPLILAPVIILTVKRGLSWYYKWKISRKQNKLITLKDEKKKTLEKVMDTETYKVAKEILEKFAPPEPPPRKNTPLLSGTDYTTPIRPNTAIVSKTTGVRQRILPTTGATPFRPILPTTSKGEAPQSLVMGTPLPMPRAILPRDRSVFDKMVDYLIGDGPTNRYALICSHCSSHNGMAYREEFEYVSFRCCYCFTFNPARKKRPVAPILEHALRTNSINSDTSESEKNSPSDTDSESESTPKVNAEVLKAAMESETEPEKNGNCTPIQLDETTSTENGCEEVVKDTNIIEEVAEDEKSSKETVEEVVEEVPIKTEESSDEIIKENDNVQD